MPHDKANTSANRTANQSANQLPVFGHYYLRKFTVPSDYNQTLFASQQLPLLKTIYYTAFNLMLPHFPSVVASPFTPVESLRRAPFFVQFCAVRKCAICITYHLSGLSKNGFARLWGISKTLLQNIIQYVVNERDENSVLDLFLDEVEAAIRTGEYKGEHHVSHTA